jgi:hypothetical protein
MGQDRYIFNSMRAWALNVQGVDQKIGTASGLDLRSLPFMRSSSLILGVWLVISEIT